MSVDPASRGTPESWLAHFNTGAAFARDGRLEDAKAEFLKAATLERNAHVQNALGTIELRLGRPSPAAERFAAAVALAPDFADAHSNLGVVLFSQLERYEEGAHHIERALALSPTDAEVLSNWTMVLEYRGRFDEAFELGKRLVERHPEFDAARLALALMLLKVGNFERAWTEYQVRRKLGIAPSLAGIHEWRGEDARDAIIWIVPEQGLGDEIMFSSCVPDLIELGARCVLQCHLRLASLFRRSFPQAQVVTTSEEALSHKPWYAVNAGSLPRLLRTRLDAFPRRACLIADAERTRRWRSRLDELPGRKKIGIAWRGGVASTRQKLRSIPLDEWAPLLAEREVAFISLQQDARSDELEAAREKVGAPIYHWQEAIDDLDELAALVAALDRVVSVQSTVVHLAGALGARVVALVSAVPEWRYGITGETLAWYPNVRLLRQRTLGAWEDVMRRAAVELTLS